MPYQKALAKKFILLAAAVATLLFLFSAAGDALKAESARDAPDATVLSFIDWVAPRPALAAEASTFTVDSEGDAADANTGDGKCATSENACTLRAAIQEANLHSGADTIAFNIPGGGVRTIKLGSDLPVLSDTTGATTIDGYTQPGSAPNTNTDSLASNATITVEITSTTAYGASGLQVHSPNNTIRGLSLFKLKDPIYITTSAAQGNTVAGNFVGTDAAGNYAATGYVDAADGIKIYQGAKRNTVGGTSAADRNVVSGNARRGVVVAGLTADSNRIINNLVGLGPKGDKRLANIKHGIDLNSGASENVVGGTQPGERNLVSGNETAGIEISHMFETTANKVIGNFIGTDVTGNSAPAYSYNSEQGVHIEDRVTNNEVAHNVIGNNKGGGIRVGLVASGNQLHDNRIGVSLNDTPIRNAAAGITIGSNSDGQRVGPNNVIANNPVGVRITDDTSDANTITSNSIFGNTGLGIDLKPLGSANPNDAGDADSGANEGLNFPVIGRATSQKVSGTACGGCTVEVFLADGGATAYGEGKTFVGSATADGGGAFAVTVSGVATGNHVTATATDSTGNTSEFSLNQGISEATDNTAPETTIDSGPAEGTVTSSSVTFDFSSSEPGSTFTCSLDGATFSSCTSPKDYANLTEGSHTFEVKATDPDGNADTTPASRTWTVDATAPTVQPPEQGFTTNAALGTNTIPVKLTWSATNGGTDVAEYKLQQSTNEGSFTTVPISPTATTKTLQLSAGNTYQFRVQAKDQAGNWSDWANGAAFTVSDYQETSSAITYAGTWTPQALSSAYGGSVNYAETNVDKAQFSFTGSNVTWIAPKGPDRGKAGVWIDGVRVGTVDLYSSTEKSRLMVFTNGWDTSGSHTLEVRALGTKNASSSGTRVDVDAFAVLN